MKKFLPIVSLMAAMMLVGCGETTSSKAPASSSKAPASSSVAPTSSKTPASSSQAPASSSQTPASSSKAPASSSQAPASSSQTPASSSVAPVIKVTVTSATLNKKQNKVYLTVAGTVENAAATAKVAVGLKIGDNWVKGSATPAAEDYTFAITAGAFTAEISLSDIQGIAEGTMQIYVGVDVATYQAVTGLTDSVKYDDGVYYFYISNYYGGVQLEKVPPIAFTETTILKQGEDVYVKFGGLKAADVTLQTMQEATSYIDFQRIPNYQLLRINNSQDQWDKYHYEVEGEKAYVLVKLDQLVSGSNYMMHFNYHANKAANFSVPATDRNFVYNGINYNLYSNPTATSEGEFYGCLGFKLTAADPEAQEGEVIAHVHEYNHVGDKAVDSALRPVTCECGKADVVGYELQAADLTSGQKNPVTGDSGKNTRLGKGDIFDDVWNITGIPAGTYELYINAQVSSGNATKGYWNSDYAVTEKGDTESNNGGSTLCKEYKYKAKIDNGEYVNMGGATENYGDAGLSDSAANWTSKALCTLTIGTGATTFTIHNMNNGYSIWVFGARLMKVASK